MGCSPSAAPRPRPNPSPHPDPQPKPINTPADGNANMADRFNSIVSGVKTIAASANMMPIVCLTRDAFPLITSYLHLEDSTPTEIQLPIIAGALHGSGRVMCFAQINFFSPKSMHTADTTKLLCNALNWVSGGLSSMTPVLALGFEKTIGGGVSRSLQDLGFFVEVGNKRRNFNNFKSVVIPSDISLEDDLLNLLETYVLNGGGLAVFYNHPEVSQQSMPINSLLSIFGLSYTFCLLNEDLEEADNIQVPANYNYVRDSNFVPISAHFKAVVKQANIDTSTLDDLVTTLRYYIMVCDTHQAEALQEIAQYAWEFLNSTNYSTQEGICPDIKHGIVVVLLQDLYSKLPITSVQPIPERETFPGKTGEVDLSDFDIQLELPEESWVSTGLWLPSQTEATVSGGPIADVQIQIGSHHESLLTKQGPWKRWPSVTTQISLSTGEVTVGSPFGGIVYVLLSSLELQKESKQANLHFHNFCEHPRAICGRSECWERTKNLDVPWGELETDHVIFTIPSEELRKIEDFEAVGDRFNSIAEGVANYMSYKPDKPYRVVFDIEVVDESASSYSYPLVFPQTDIPGIMEIKSTPTLELFKAISLMTIASIREDCFDETTESAIATVATAVIFQKLFPNFDPFDFEGLQLPTLFHELWEIHKNCDPGLIPETLKKFQDPNYPVSDVPEDMWIAFVREMCRIGQKDFTGLLERSRPIPLNISISLQGLPPYQSSGM